MDATILLYIGMGIIGAAVLVGIMLLCKPRNGRF